MLPADKNLPYIAALSMRGLTLAGDATECASAAAAELRKNGDDEGAERINKAHGDFARRIGRDEVVMSFQFLSAASLLIKDVEDLAERNLMTRQITIILMEHVRGSFPESHKLSKEARAISKECRENKIERHHAAGQEAPVRTDAGLGVKGFPAARYES